MNRTNQFFGYAVAFGIMLAYFGTLAYLAWGEIMDGAIGKSGCILVVLFFVCPVAGLFLLWVLS